MTINVKRDFEMGNFFDDVADFVGDQVRDLNPIDPNTLPGQAIHTITSSDEILRGVTDIYVSNNTNRYINVGIEYQVPRVDKTLDGRNVRGTEGRNIVLAPGQQNAFIADNVYSNLGSVSFSAVEVTPDNCIVPGGLQWQTTRIDVPAGNYTFNFNY